VLSERQQVHCEKRIALSCKSELQERVWKTRGDGLQSNSTSYVEIRRKCTTSSEILSNFKAIATVATASPRGKRFSSKIFLQLIQLHQKDALNTTVTVSQTRTRQIENWSHQVKRRDKYISQQQQQGKSWQQLFPIKVLRKNQDHHSNRNRSAVTASQTDRRSEQNWWN
jgi:hypothetical protein